MAWSLIIAAGLINWLATTIIVESEITRPLRDWLTLRRMSRIELPPEHTDAYKTVVISYAQRISPVYEKVAYLFGCHLCSGTWVGLVEAIAFGPVISSGFVGIVATGLLFKAVGHLVLELVALGRKLRGE